MLGKTILNYEILDKLGSGGMGEVYLAEDSELHRKVALKFLPSNFTTDPSIKARFKQEARAIAALNHPNIITIYETGEHDGQSYIAMEYVDAGSLKDEIAGKGVSIEQVINIATQICEGLEAAHLAGIIHRDIKPANILLEHSGRVKICDFGLAKSKGVTNLTRSSSTLGTLSYMSPEQIKGSEVNHRSDIFSLGIVLYEMITGRLPFAAEYEAAITYSILNEQPEPLARYKSGIPDELQRIVDKALSKEPTTRYQSIPDLLADLKTLATPSTPPVKQSFMRRHLLSASIGLMMGLVALAVFSLSDVRFFGGPAETDAVGTNRYNSIAVMPFDNLSPDPEQEYFCDGMTEDVITQLSKISDMRVVSRMSTMRYKGTKKTLREIGEELGVSVILEGSVRRADNRVRIVSQLIDTETDEHLWAETYDRQLEDIFSIQSDIAKQIANTLNATLAAVGRDQAENQPTANLTAYDYYLKAREYLHRFKKQDNEQAITLYEKAIQLDSAFALAWAGLGVAYAQRAAKFSFEAFWLDSALVICKKAVALDRSTASILSALGLIYMFKGFFTESLEWLEEAVRLDPNFIPPSLGSVHRARGELAEALIWSKRSISQDPLNAFWYVLVAETYRRLDAPELTREWLNKAVALQPDLHFSYVTLAALSVAQQNDADAWKHVEKLLSLDPKDAFSLEFAGWIAGYTGRFSEAKHYYQKSIATRTTSIDENPIAVSPIGLAHVLWREGQRAKARKLLDQSLHSTLSAIDQGDQYFYKRYEIAAIHAIQGNKEEAYLWLEQAIDSGWRDYKLGLRDPWFADLHNEERYLKMMSQVKAMVDSMRHRAEEMG